MWPEKTNKRNESGVKDSFNTFRTFGGEHYPHWEIDPSPEYVANLRAAGCRVRRVKDELYIHHADIEKAKPVPGYR